MVKVPGLRIRLLISLLLALVTTLIFLGPGTRYVINIPDRSQLLPDKQFYFEDLDGDGNSECLKQHLTSSMVTSLIIYDDDDGIIDQYNFPGRKVVQSDIFYGDFDGNNWKEAYLFTYLGDSVLLNIFEPFNPGDQIRKL